MQIEQTWDGQNQPAVRCQNLSFQFDGTDCLIRATHAQRTLTMHFSVVCGVVQKVVPFMSGKEG